MAVRMQNELALTPLIYIKPPQRERSRLSEGAVLLSPYQIDTRGETHQSNYLKSIGREAPCFGMLSPVSRQLFLWQQALFPMTRSLAVAEAAGGLGVFMAAGLAPPTSGAGLMCPAPSQAVR